MLLLSVYQAKQDLPLQTLACSTAEAMKEDCIRFCLYLLPQQTVGSIGILPE